MMSDEAKARGTKIELAQFDSEKNLWRLSLPGDCDLILSEDELIAFYWMMDEKLAPTLQKRLDQEDQRHRDIENTNRKWCEKDEQ